MRRRPPAGSFEGSRRPRRGALPRPVRPLSLIRNQFFFGVDREDTGQTLPRYWSNNAATPVKPFHALCTPEQACREKTSVTAYSSSALSFLVLLLHKQVSLSLSLTLLEPVLLSLLLWLLLWRLLQWLHSLSPVLLLVLLLLLLLGCCFRCVYVFCQLRTL